MGRTGGVDDSNNGNDSTDESSKYTNLSSTYTNFYGGLNVVYFSLYGGFWNRDRDDGESFSGTSLEFGIGYPFISVGETKTVNNPLTYPFNLFNFSPDKKIEIINHGAVRLRFRRINESGEDKYNQVQLSYVLPW